MTIVCGPLLYASLFSKLIECSAYLHPDHGEYEKQHNNEQGNIRKSLQIDK